MHQPRASYRYQPDQEKSNKMIQVMSLPYLLQSLVSTKKATCVQPQSKGTVHHYPVRCNDGGSNQYNYNNTSVGMEDRSSTANCTARVNYQCCPAVAGNEGTRNIGAGGTVQVKREVMDDQTHPGYQTLQHCSPGPKDTTAYHNLYQNRYTVAYPQPNARYCCQKANRTHSALKTDMSLDIDSLFTEQQGPLSPLSLSPDQGSLSPFYSATTPSSSSMADFSSIYDLPPIQTLPCKTTTTTTFTDMMGGGCDDIPVFTKMDPNGCELLSLDDLSNSEFNYLNSDVGSSLDQDWLIEPVSLPSPEEQDSDIKFSSLPATINSTTTTITAAMPPRSLSLSATTQFSSSPPPSSATLCMLTPDPSLPPSPNSILSYSSEEEEIQDVLASFNDEGHCLPPFAPNQILPFDTSSHLLDVDSPSSCLMSMPSSPEEESRSSFDGDICDLLDGSKSSSRSLSLPSLTPLPESAVSGRTERSTRKRKSLPINSDQQSSSAPAPASKRRMSKASKKERKREQNKTAALRYRQKKKGEKVDVEVRRTELEDANKKLKAQVASLENEINYLKKLSHEVNKRIQSQQSSS